jgi:hypothetical protein
MELKSPVQSCVPKGNNQPNDVIAIECPLNAISGSLLPFGISNGVFAKVRIPAVVPAIVTDSAAVRGATAAVTVIMAVALFVVSFTEVAVSTTVLGVGAVAGAL